MGDLLQRRIGQIGERCNLKLERKIERKRERDPDSNETAEITADRQEDKLREDPFLSGRTQKWTHWKKEKGV